MGKTIVLYKSNTGFTQKYAEWIAEELNCKAVSIDKLDVNSLFEYNTIIFGGGIHAGQISGLKSIKNSILKMTDKKIIIFATGATPPAAMDTDGLKNKNFSLEEQERLQFFYFLSGMNYETMGIKNKGLMGVYRFVLRLNKDKSSVEQGVYDTLTKSNDHTKKEYINPLIEHVKLIDAS